MTAWVRSQDNEAFKKAVHARPRLGLDKPLAAGTWVKVWRNHMGFTGWVGPGVILSESPHGRSYWISMRGSIWKVSRERIREATAEESLGVELTRILTKDMLQDSERGNFRDYVDVNAESAPPDDGDDEPGVRFADRDEVIEIPSASPGEPAPEAEPQAAAASAAPATSAAPAALRDERDAEVDDRRVRPRMESCRGSEETLPQPFSEPSLPSRPTSETAGSPMARPPSEAPTWGPAPATSAPRALPYPASADTQFLPSRPRLLLTVVDPDSDRPCGGS